MGNEELLKDLAYTSFFLGVLFGSLIGVYLGVFITESAIKFRLEKFGMNPISIRYIFKSKNKTRNG